MMTNTGQSTTRRRTLTKTVSVEGDDMNLAGLADVLDDLIGGEMARIEDAGGEIVGAVSVSRAQAVTTDYQDGSYRGTTTTEKGMVATITYRIDVAVDGKATD